MIAKALRIEKFFALGERYVNAADTAVGNLARALFVHHQHFFTFRDGNWLAGSVYRSAESAGEAVG